MIDARARLRKASFSLLFIVATPAIAEGGFPFTQTPASLPGLSTSFLQPVDTFTIELGTRQTGARANGGTGTQVYDWSVGLRRDWPFQVGLSFHIYDDQPKSDIFGSSGRISFASASVDGKYALYQSDRLGVAVEGSASYMTYSNGEDVDDTFIGGTISAPISYQIDPSLVATAEVGYTVLPNEVSGQDGFGNRGFASAGLSWQPTDRITVYGSAKILLREIETGLEGDTDQLYTVGGRYALTPQTSATFFATNAYSDSPILDDLAFFVAAGDVSFGAALTFVPSRKRFNIPRYGTSNVAAADKRLRFADGVTMMGPATIGSNELRATLSYGSSDNPSLSLFLSPDPDFQVEFIFENYALADDNPFRPSAVEDTRYSAGLRYQAFAEAEGDPFTLGARVALGRDIDRPTVGVVFAEAALRKDLRNGFEVTFAPRAAAVSDKTFLAAGFGAGWNAADNLRLLGEYSFAGGDADADVWALGLTRSFPEALSSIDVFVTNAAGRTGVGSMLAGETRYGVSFSWQPPFNLF